MKKDIVSMLPEELEEDFALLGEQKFRAKQVFQWLSRGVRDFDKMTNLSKPLREKLKGEYELYEPKVIGKPQPEMALLAMERTGYSPRQTCLIGDRVYTDIACGVNAGIDTIFVLSGEGVMTDIEKYHVQPTYCMQNIREVLNTLQKGEEK